MTQQRDNNCGRNTQRGYVLLVVVIISLALFGATTGYLRKASHGMREAMYETRRLQANEIARAGIPLALQMLKNVSGQSTASPARIEFESGVLQIEMTALEDSPNHFHVRCQGHTPVWDNPLATAEVNAVASATPGQVTGEMNYRYVFYSEGELDVTERSEQTETDQKDSM